MCRRAISVVTPMCTQVTWGFSFAGLWQDMGGRQNWGPLQSGSQHVGHALGIALHEIPRQKPECRRSPTHILRSICNGRSLPRVLRLEAIHSIVPSVQ